MTVDVPKPVGVGDQNAGAHVARFRVFYYPLN